MEKLVVPVGLVLICSAALLIARMVLFKVLLGWARRTETKIDDIVIASLRFPSLFWAVALGASLGIGLSELPARYTAGITLAISLLLIVSATIASANLAGRIFSSFIQSKQLPFPSTGLAYGIIKGTIYLVGLLVMLAQMGISIAPLLTALGVGGLAVALALQDTLANVFAGLHIIVERSIRVGDFIRLESGQEGYVDDITWRTTRVRMLPNNIVVIPNSKLAQSVVTNYYLPEKRMSLLIPVSVSYASDPEQVERILVEEAKEGAKTIPGLLAEPEPFVRFIPGFGDSSLDFTLICQVAEFTDQYVAQHELRKRIFKRFKAEGIDIPFPQRTVHLREERIDR